MDALSSSIMATQTRLLQHEHNYADFKRSSYTSFMKLQDNQNTLAKNFDKYRKEGQNAIKLVNRNMEMFQLEHRLMVETLTFVVDALSNITISYTYKLNAAITQLNEYHTALSRFVDGMSDLTQGKLSTSLVPPYKLEAALNNVTRSAKERKAHMDVIDVAVSSYYNRKDTVFVVHNGTLYIQLEVFTKYKEAEIYTLYEIVTIPMPFDMTDISTKARPFTQLIPRKKYFAVTSKSYMEFEQHHLDGCKTYGLLSVCPQAILQRDADSSSCISRIWYKKTKSQVLTLCDFRFLPEHDQQPNVLDTGTEVLISGFDTPWSVNCEYDFFIQHYHEVNYALIPHNQLCGCAIMGTGMHVKSFLEGCNDQRERFRPVFPINAAVVLMSLPKGINFDTSKLYFSVEDVPMRPAVPQILTANDHSIASNDDDFKTIELLKVMDLEKEGQAIYDSKSDIAILGNNMQSWFNSGKFSYILITLGSILGTVSIIISVYAVTKGCKTSTLLSAIHNVPKSDALDPAITQPIEVSLTQYFEQALANVVIIVAILVVIALRIVKLVNNCWCNNHIQPNQDYHGYLTEIYVELFDNIDYVRLKGLFY